MMSIEADGFIVLPSLIRPDQCKEARERLIAIHAAGLAQGKYRPKAATTANVSNLQSKDHWFMSLMDLPRVEHVLKPLLNDAKYHAIPANEPNYILAEFHGRSSGRTDLHMHMDSYMPSIDRRPCTVTVLIALEDRGPGEGCTIVVPGSHLSGNDPEPPVRPVSVPLKAGDGVIWDGRIWHGAYPRTTVAMGWALLMTFTRWWVKQPYDIPGTLPAAVKEALTPKQLALLGFCSSTPAEDGVPMMRGYDSL